MKSDFPSSDGYEPIPVRSEIIVLPADDPGQLKLGLRIIENIGIGIINPRGIAAGRKSTKGILGKVSEPLKVTKTRLSDKK